MRKSCRARQLPRSMMKRWSTNLTNQRLMTTSSPMPTTAQTAAGMKDLPLNPSQPLRAAVVRRKHLPLCQETHPGNRRRLPRSLPKISPTALRVAMPRSTTRQGQTRPACLLSHLRRPDRPETTFPVKVPILREARRRRGNRSRKIEAEKVRPRQEGGGRWIRQVRNHDCNGSRFLVRN